MNKKSTHQKAQLFYALLKKTPIAMRITLVLLFLLVFQIQAEQIHSQNTKISLDMKNSTVEKVLQTIEEKSDYYFLYNSRLINVDRKVSVRIRNAAISAVLQRLFQSEDVNYEVKGSQIILSPKEIHNQITAVVEALQQQKKTITGTVVDASGTPIIGANIVETGTTNGTVTDVDGKFSLNVENDATIHITYIGYLEQSIATAGKSAVDITLLEDTKALDEVVVVGYGTMKKNDLTGSISQIKTKDIELTPINNLEQALKSQAAGVSIRQNSGRPGGNIEVRIRGGNSMIGGNEPLYVLDGFPVGSDINFLNPSDIESINILKDASATSIYGSRGANGVIIITTKRGKVGEKSKITINSLYGIQSTTKRYKMLDARQYAEVVNEWLRNSGKQPYFNLDEIQNPGTDWQDFIFRNAPINDHTLTFSGASEKTRFSLSGNLYNQQGILKYSGIKKGSFRINLDHEINKIISLSVNLNTARSEQNNVPADNSAHGGSMLSGALAAPPTLPIYDINGEITRISQIYSFGSIGMINPAVYFPPYKNRSLQNTLIGNSSLRFNITNHLSLNSLFGIEYVNNYGDSFIPIIYSDDRGSASQSYRYQNTYLMEHILTYEKTFYENHNLNIVGGYTHQSNINRNLSIGVDGFDNNITQNYNLSSAKTINIPISGISEWKLVSFLGRLNYSFKNKYYLTTSVRADGSSRFGKNNKWGLFPSGAIAWRLSEEPFMKDFTFINSFKLRTSYGVTGNTALSPYQSLNRLSSVKYIFGGTADAIGFVPSGIANKDLKWETTNQFDIGFDLNIFDNKYRIIFDYYKKNTKNLLASVPLPPSVGFGTSLQNIGEIQNSGLEFSAQADLIRRDFKWDISGQISTNRNKVIKLAGGSDIYTGSLNIFGNISLAREGEPLGMFYGFTEDGLDENGYIKYVDRNRDGNITQLDRSIIGNPYPDFTYGFISNFSYKNFELNIFLEGVQGNDIWWATAGTHLNSFQRGSNQFADLYGNYWTKENPNPKAKYPKVSATSQIGDSDRFVKDGSYLRLKSIRLAYDIPIDKMNLPWINSGQIYVSGTNLFTKTNYPGIDPDVNTAGGSYLVTGVDENAYPISKVYTIGLKLNF